MELDNERIHKMEKRMIVLKQRVCLTLGCYNKIIDMEKKVYCQINLLGGLLLSYKQIECLVKSHLHSICVFV